MIQQALRAPDGERRNNHRAAATQRAFADNGVSIQVVRQDGHGDEAGLVVRTHTATDAALAATIERLRSTDAVRNVVGVMRVEGEDGR